MAEENPGKPQLGDHLMKIVQSVVASNGVGRIAQNVRKGDGREKGKNSNWRHLV
jgi:hypothetical protein